MLRNILGVIAGYAVMALCIFLVFTVAYLVLGADGAFRPESWQVSTTWLILSIVVGLGAAWVGGLVCQRIAQSTRAAVYLIAVVVILGIVTIVFTGDPAMTDPRLVDPGWQNAMNNAQQPAWIMYLNPFIGALGIAWGGGLLSKE